MYPHTLAPTNGIPNKLKFMIPAIDNFISSNDLWFSPNQWFVYFPDPENVLLLSKNTLLSFELLRFKN